MIRLHVHLPVPTLEREVVDVAEGMPVGGGRFVGILDVMDRALANFYGAFDVRLLVEEFISQGENVVAVAGSAPG